MDFGEAALKVMEIGSEMATLEKQYAALNQVCPLPLRSWTQLRRTGEAVRGAGSNRCPPSVWAQAPGLLRTPSS